ncbi:MAG: hypothetical protein PWP53_1067 [Lacrimispora sp.]|nr:hypothetical protein [Lacrimispora sp.]
MAGATAKSHEKGAIWLGNDETHYEKNGSIKILMIWKH